MKELIIKKDQLKDIHFEGINGQQANDFNELVQINRSKEIVLTLSTPSPMDKLVGWLEEWKRNDEAQISIVVESDYPGEVAAFRSGESSMVNQILAKAKELK